MSPKKKYISMALAVVTLLGMQVPSFAASHEPAKSVVEQTIKVEPLTEYRLSKYDVINISILGFDESSFKDIMIGPDGYVNLPYTGIVKLAGLTIPEASEILQSKLGEYIKIPGMAVMVKQYGPRKVYVMGEVGKPGMYTLGWDNMNVLAALSTSGGIKFKGRPKHVAVIRQSGDKVEMREINFEALTNKADLSQNVLLQDGDLIFVPQSNKIDFFGEIMPIIQTGYYLKQITKE